MIGPDQFEFGLPQRRSDTILRERLELLAVRLDSTDDEIQAEQLRLEIARLRWIVDREDGGAA